MAKAKILGKLRGIIASAKEPSRNGRKYTEGFWDTLFNRDIFEEGIKNRVFFGELAGHPDDSEEYSQIHCDDRSAIVLTNVKKDGLDYIGDFDILPTKAGQCLRNLLDVGCIFGISSRGLADYDSSIFDENLAKTYDLITWDIVAFPGVKSCRLHEVGAVAEGFSYGRKINKTKVMENLQSMQKSDEFYDEYISEILKAKEDFDTELQIEDIMDSLYGISDTDLISAGNYVIVENNIPYYDDGIHGKLNVYTPSMSGLTINDGDIYLVDNIVYKNGEYVATGEWIKLN